MEMDAGRMRDELRGLIDEYRSRCLWFLREDYYPRTRSEMLRVLARIQSHGDLDAFRKAGKLKRWLLVNSNETFAD
jgi:hypothetical protein